MRVALFEYGNTRLPAAEGYLRQVVPLTDDLDRVSAALFGLTTNGGDEYCGQVISEAVSRLDWSTQPGAYKTIFIAGNEPFTQGDVDFRSAVPRAIQSGIVVNTIHCGPAAQGQSGHWAEGARLGEGRHFNIDQDHVKPTVSTPHDVEILRINTELNQTYLWYGREREELRRNQAQQDANAASVSESVAVSRSVTKASKVYSNRGRDLVDTFVDAQGVVDAEKLAQVPADQLPAPMQALDAQQRADVVAKNMQQRRALQTQLQALQAKRETHLAQHAAAMPQGPATLGDALQDTVTTQLQERGFEVQAATQPATQPAP